MPLRLTAVLLLTALPALGQDADGRYQLYINPSTLITASRLVGLGGASVGLAENTESLPFNYAAAGQRSPRRTRHWDWDVTFSFLTAPIESMRDVDNEGTPAQSIAPVEGQLGGTVQWKRFGIGAYFRLSNRDTCLTDACGPDDKLGSTALQGAIVFGFTAWEDQLAFGAGINIANARFRWEGTRSDYFGANVGGGMLYRPHFLPFRIGASVVSATTGNPSVPLTASSTIAGRPAFSSIVTPARISVGASARLGEGSWRFNRLSYPAVQELGTGINAAAVPHDFDDDPRPPGRWLLSVQLDLIFPVQNAIILNSFIENQPHIAGDAYFLVPRAGAEYEILEHRLRSRAGFYLEAPFLQGSQFRPHGTLGGELYVLKLFGAEWSVGLAMDVAPRYFSLSFGIGWWNAG